MMSWDIIHKATQEDGTMLKLMDHIRRGMPNSVLELDNSLREYYSFRHYLHVVDVLQRSHCGPGGPANQEGLTRQSSGLESTQRSS